MGAVWNLPAKSLHVCVIGLGGVGSWLALMLGRIGYKLTLMDPDTVSEQNMSGQLLAADFIDIPKVNACLSVLNTFGVDEKEVVQDKFVGNFDAKVGAFLDCQVLVSAADSMAVRLDAWQTYMDNPAILMMVDVRMAMENFAVYVLTKNDPSRAERWRQEWFDDSQADPEVCTLKATSHCGATCASFAVGLINNWVANHHLDMRNLPYRTEFNFQSMFARHE